MTKESNAPERLQTKHTEQIGFQDLEAAIAEVSRLMLPREQVLYARTSRNRRGKEQDMTTQPEALRLAEWLDSAAELGGADWDRKISDAASELRRLHAEVEALRADAERLAWMIENQKHPLKFDPGWTMADEEGYHYGEFYPTAQAAIDAARSKT